MQEHFLKPGDNQGSRSPNPNTLSVDIKPQRQAVGMQTTVEVRKPCAAHVTVNIYQALSTCQALCLVLVSLVVS